MGISSEVEFRGCAYDASGNVRPVAIQLTSLHVLLVRLLRVCRQGSRFMFGRAFRAQGLPHVVMGVLQDGQQQEGPQNGGGCNVQVQALVHHVAIIIHEHANVEVDNSQDQGCPSNPPAYHDRA